MLTTCSWLLVVDQVSADPGYKSIIRPQHSQPV